MNGLREQVFRCHSMSVVGFAFQACSFNHSDISHPSLLESTTCERLPNDHRDTPMTMRAYCSCPCKMRQASRRDLSVRSVSSSRAARCDSRRYFGLQQAPDPFLRCCSITAGIARSLRKRKLSGQVFAKHRYTFLYLFRRGYGLSANHGEPMRDILDREAQAGGEEARKRLQLRLSSTDHLDDVMAGLAFLKRVANVDRGRVVVGGHSTGGQLTLLTLERDKSVRAAVGFCPAAQTWEGSPELQNRLLAAARNIETPIFLTHPANDFSIVPGQKLGIQ